MSLESYVVGQFREPRGPAGRIAGWIMSHRGSNRQRNLWTLDLLELEPGQELLEIGFGPGFAIHELLERYPGVRVMGLDHSREMLRQASRLNRSGISTGRVQLRCGPVENLASLDRRFDRVYSSNVAQFWTDRVGTFRSILGLLGPGGRVVTTYLPRKRGASDSDSLAFGNRMLAEMEEAGFRERRLEMGPRVPVLTVSAVGIRGSGEV